MWSSDAFTVFGSLIEYAHMFIIDKFTTISTYKMKLHSIHTSSVIISQLSHVLFGSSSGPSPPPPPPPATSYANAQ